MATVNTQEALLEDNRALRKEIADAQAALDKAGRDEPAMRLCERIERLVKAHAAAERTIAALQVQIKELSDAH